MVSAVDQNDPGYQAQGAYQTQGPTNDRRYENRCLIRDDMDRSIDDLLNLIKAILEGNYDKVKKYLKALFHDIDKLGYDSQCAHFSLTEEENEAVYNFCLGIDHMLGDHPNPEWYLAHKEEACVLIGRVSSSYINIDPDRDF